MKKVICVLSLAGSLARCAFTQGTNEMAGLGMSPGMSGSYGTEQATVLKVFSAQENDARFRAYQVKWKNQDVIVSDTFGTSNFKEGDKITFMFQNIAVPISGKTVRMLHFMYMDLGTFAPGPTESRKTQEGDLTGEAVSAQVSGTAVKASNEEPRAQKFLTYSVKEGENLNMVATRWGVSLNDLKALNHLTSTALKAGTVLKIPTAP